MAKKKPKWSKPKLIVLVRGDAQEGILQSCKYLAGSGLSGETGELDSPVDYFCKTAYARKESLCPQR